MSIGPDILKALLDEGGMKYRVGSQSFILSCPRCRKHDKLYIRKRDGRFVCWVCKETEGFSGKPEYVLSELLGRPIREIAIRLYGETEQGSELLLDVNLRDYMSEEELVDQVTVRVQPEVYPDPGFRELPGSRGESYLALRGIPLEIAQEYNIKYYPATNRVIFPVESRGKLLGWQARYIGATEYYDKEVDMPITIPKILTTPGLEKDQVLMFGDRITGEHAVLTEGPVSAIKAHLCGGNVATMGKAVSRQQLQLLRGSGIKRLYLALDPDAFVESQKLLQELADDVVLYDMRPPDKYDDIGDMPIQDVLGLFRSAPRIDRNYLFLYLKDHYAQ